MDPARGSAGRIVGRLSRLDYMDKWTAFAVYENGGTPRWIDGWQLFYDDEESARDAVVATVQSLVMRGVFAVPLVIDLVVETTPRT